MEDSCRICGGSSFTVDNDKMCNECGTIEAGYLVLESQEMVGDVDKTRVIKVTKEKVKTGPDKNLNKYQWSSYEWYNSVLCEWTKALMKLGASERLPDAVYRCWVTYLQRLEVAFFPPTNRNKRGRVSLGDNIREIVVLQKKDKKLSEKSFDTPRKKRRRSLSETANQEQSEQAKLDKLKEKVKSRKRRRQIRDGDDKNKSLNKFLASEFSKSINDMESSYGYISDGNQTYTSDTSFQNYSQSGASVSASGVSSCSDTEKGKERVKYNKISQKVLRMRQKRFLKIIKDKKKLEMSLSPTSDSEEEEIERKLQRNARKRSRTFTEGETRWYQMKIPFHLTFDKLLSILYLGVLLAEEDILLSDILRWCHEGHIPFTSAQYLLDQDMKLFRQDLYKFYNNRSVPSTGVIQENAGKMAVYLSLQHIPLPSQEGVLERLVKVLKLPDVFRTYAGVLLKRIKMDSDTAFKVPGIEIQAMAAIVVVLKLYCGLDGRQEVLLSSTAQRLNQHFHRSHDWTPLFSWNDWENYIISLLWFCTQISPTIAVQLYGVGGINYVKKKFVADFYWQEGIWRLPKTIKMEENTPVLEKVLDAQRVSLEDLLNQPQLFHGSREPLVDIVEQFMTKYENDTSESLEDLLKVGKGLQEKNFSSHTLNWMSELKTIQKKLKQSGSQLTLQTKSRKKKIVVEPNELLMQSLNDSQSEQQYEKEELVLQVPDPTKCMWEVEANIKKKIYPPSFEWLLKLGCFVTKCAREELLADIALIENFVKEYCKTDLIF